MMKRALLLILPLLILFRAGAQQVAAIDSMKSALSQAETAREKCYWLDHLSRALMNVNLREAEQYGQQFITLAEESRDRELMVDAYLSNGLRCSYFSGQKEYLPRAIDYYTRGLDIARKEKLTAKTGEALLRLSAIYLVIPDKDKALAMANQAYSVISPLQNDSLEAEANNSYGHVFLARNEKTMALRHYFNALHLSETTNKGRGNPELIRNCYLHLSKFYSLIDDYDKAIDYATLAFGQLEKSRNRNVPYQRAIDLNSIGNLYAMKQNPDIAISYFERSVSMADSLQFSSLKVPGYISILNQYLRTDKPAEALAFMGSARGQALSRYLHDFGFSGVVDHAYAIIYTGLGKYDSARIYFRRASPYFERSTSEGNKIGYYQHLARFYKAAGERDSSIAYFLKLKEAGERIGQLENVKTAARELDSLYMLEGKYLLANRYKETYYRYKDSIEHLSKEKDLAQLEAADEQQRQERLALERLENERRRNNIQYLGIVIGIVALFVLLVVLGMFKVSATGIRLLGFFTFLMFFEFIFLVFKKNIYSITHGEPWKDLAFMIGLAAILLPLHHWLEEKVIHYLTSHNRLTSAGVHIRRQLFSRSKAGNE